MFLNDLDTYLSMGFGDRSISSLIFSAGSSAASFVENTPW
jgi:hypothetical protein